MDAPNLRRPEEIPNLALLKLFSTVVVLAGRTGNGTHPHGM